MVIKLFTDTHCHILNEYYEDIDKILENAKNVGINRVINNGCDHKSNLEIIDLIKKYPNMYGAIGIHPEVADTYEDKDLRFIEQNLDNPKIIAIGEIGLDYHYTKDNKEKQIELFETQLRMAEKYHKPIIVHSRDATEDTIKILKKHKVTGVIHSFSGSFETAQIYLKMGFLLGINGVITFKNSKLKDVIEKLDLNNIILETDSPYLTPEPFRGTKNEPAKISNIADFICNLKDVSQEELANITKDNIKRIFDI